MSIIRKVKQINNVFNLLEKEMAVFQQKSGLGCLTGCGHCCTKPDVSAAVIEFLPYALDLFIQKKSSSMKELIKNNTSSICHLFKNEGSGQLGNIHGGCTQYHNRGLICRLFGFATSRDKHGEPRLSTCKWIKGDQEVLVKEAESRLLAYQAPSYLVYYQKLTQIDFRMGQEFLPINDALIRAIEVVENYYQYRPFPYAYKNSA